MVSEYLKLKEKRIVLEKKLLDGFYELSGDKTPMELLQMVKDFMSSQFNISDTAKICEFVVSIDYNFMRPVDRRGVHDVSVIIYQIMSIEELIYLVQGYMIEFDQVEENDVS